MTDKTYQYTHPHPAVTTDIVIFTVQDDSLKLLLIQRGVEPFKGQWALPGGFINMDEDLDHAAARELEEETGVCDVYLEQFKTWGAPKRDPRERVITVAYFAIIPSDKITLAAGSDADNVQWFDYQKLPALAFDHADIVKQAHETLVDKLKRTTVVIQFLPEEFTLTQLQRIHEIILNEDIDKRNFRKWVESLDYIQATGKKETGSAHRPAMLYTATTPDNIQPAKWGKRENKAVAKVDDETRQVIHRQGYNEGLEAAMKQLKGLRK